MELTALWVTTDEVSTRRNTSNLCALISLFFMDRGWSFTDVIFILGISGRFDGVVGRAGASLLEDLGLVAVLCVQGNKETPNTLLVLILGVLGKVEMPVKELAHGLRVLGRRREALQLRVGVIGLARRGLLDRLGASRRGCHLLGIGRAVRRIVGEGGRQVVVARDGRLVVGLAIGRIAGLIRETVGTARLLALSRFVR